MTDSDIIQELKRRLSVPTGRHLYSVLGTYSALKRFAVALQMAADITGRPFPAPLSVNRELLGSFEDERFHELAASEAKYPQETKGEIQKAFEIFVTRSLHRDGLVVLHELEILFAYGVELGLMRAEAADNQRLLLLLPGRRSAGKVELFPEAGPGRYTLPPSLIADNQTWDLEA